MQTIKLLTKRNLTLLAAFAAATASLWACAAEDDGILPEDGDVQAASADSEAKADAPSIPFTVFTDDAVGNQPAARVVFKNQGAYHQYFGHNAPSSVNFSKSWVIFYSAGSQPTTGYDASIESVAKSQTGITLKVTTSLSSPGSSCIEGQIVTNPKVFVKIAKQTTTAVRFYSDDTTTDCSPPICIQNVLCPINSHYDNTPGVCKCVPNDPCAGVRCITGSTCQVVNGTAQCSNLCDTVRCAAGFHCQATGNAVGCQPDACPPNTLLCMNGYHYDGTPGVCGCVPNPVTAPACGGIAGIQCHGFAHCVDNAGDSCDPNHGGADCPSHCECIQTVTCVIGKRFNNDPSVCACQ